MFHVSHSRNGTDDNTQYPPRVLVIQQLIYVDAQIKISNLPTKISNPLRG